MSRRYALGTVVVLALLGLAPASALASNDDVAGAAPIAYGHLVAVTASAFTTEIGEPQTFGGPASLCGVTGARTAWFTVTGTGGPLVFNTAGSSAPALTVPADAPPNDTVLGVYSGSPGSLVAVACNDDESDNIHTSRVALATSAPGQRLYIQVGLFCSDATNCANATARTPATLALTASDFTPNRDLDGDGVLGPPFGADCNDHDPTIHPGAIDKPGDGIDQDCDGHDAPFPPIGASVSASVLFFKHYTTFHTISVKKAPAGSTITLKCSGKKGSCPFKSKKIKVHKAKSVVNLKKTFRKAKLRKGAKVEVRVTKAGFVGVFVRLTIKKLEALPQRRELCLPPGKSAPRACV